MFFLKKVLKMNVKLTKNEQKILKKKLIDLKRKEYNLREEILFSEMALIYNSYKEQGFSLNEVRKFYIKDLDTIKNAKEFLKKQNILKKYMFGYPANMENSDYIEEFLKYLEIKMPFSNNCGENYSRKTKCNYAMDSKKWEYQIVGEICNNLGLSNQNYEGYITSGGTEGNFFGIKNGFEKLNNSVFYYSSSSHYSVPKFINLLGKESVKIECNLMGEIDSSKLISVIEKNWQERQKTAVILLTWRTTETGAIDDVEGIVKNLKLKKFLIIYTWIQPFTVVFQRIKKNLQI